MVSCRSQHIFPRLRHNLRKLGARTKVERKDVANILSLVRGFNAQVRRVIAALMSSVILVEKRPHTVDVINLARKRRRVKIAARRRLSKNQMCPKVLYHLPTVE
jgi:hypothetical protein